MSVAPEQAGTMKFSDEIKQVGYDRSKELVRIPWDIPVDYLLLEKMVEFNMLEKADCQTFWRKSNK